MCFDSVLSDCVLHLEAGRAACAVMIEERGGGEMAKHTYTLRLGATLCLCVVCLRS